MQVVSRPCFRLCVPAAGAFGGFVAMVSNKVQPSARIESSPSAQLKPIRPADVPPQVINPSNDAALGTYLAAYPGTRDYHSYVRHRGDERQPAFRLHSDGWGELSMNWEVRAGESVNGAGRLEFLESITQPYCGKLHFFPVVGHNDSPMHPLTAWWAILHALSMLARYHPAEWAAHIDVDNSPHAVPVERLLKRALLAVPRLVLETLRQVSR